MTDTTSLAMSGRNVDYINGYEAGLEASTRPQLSVWFDCLPESNGKRNWTVILHRTEGSVMDGQNFHRSEFYDQARYAADELRYLIGETDVQPDILTYDENLKEPR